MVCCVAEGTGMLHDDVVGEEITEEEEYNVKASIVMAVTGREFEEGMDLRFPGSQPVSLARSNIDMLNFKRYWVTWKVSSSRKALAVTSSLPNS
jgi:mRNA-capping enzyme